jgi:hypothetical protein
VERRYSSYLHFLVLGTRWGVSGQRHSSAALYPPPPGNGPPVHIGQEAWWAPEPVWTQRPEEKSFASAGDQSPVVESVVRLLTELPQLLLGDAAGQMRVLSSGVSGNFHEKYGPLIRKQSAESETGVV